MGAWGVTARESDYGLDTLTRIEMDYLKPIDFKHFDVKGVMEFCRNHIIEGLRREHEPYVKNKERLQYYIDANLPYRYNTVIQLVAECLSEFSQKGVFVILDYEAKKKMKIEEFIFTGSVLDELLEELYKMLDPTHDVYTSWFEEDTRQEWIAHMKMMCDSIVKLKSSASPKKPKKPAKAKINKASATTKIAKTPKETKKSKGGSVNEQ